MFRNHEPRLASVVLAAPVLALLMAGSAALPSKVLPATPASEPNVQLGAAAGMDLSFSPVGFATQPTNHTALAVEASPACVMDLVFTPASETTSAVATPSSEPVTALDLIPVGTMDLSFTPAAY